MAKFIIKFHYPARASEFVGGGSYIFQGEKYAVFSRGSVDAKLYTSQNRAKSAAEKLAHSCVNTSFDYEILEVEDDD